MQDLKLYWKQVRQLEADLKQSHPDVVYLVTLSSDNGVTPGLVKLATATIAAKALVDGSHELATLEQIEKYHAEQALEARRITAFENRMHGHPVTLVQLTSEGAVFTERNLLTELAKR